MGALSVVLIAPADIVLAFVSVTDARSAVRTTRAILSTGTHWFNVNQACFLKIWLRIQFSKGGRPKVVPVLPRWPIECMPSTITYNWEAQSDLSD
jgi:hypothetical protein